MHTTLICNLLKMLSCISTLLYSKPRGASALFRNSHLTKTRSRARDLVHQILSSDGLGCKVQTIMEELNPSHEDPAHFKEMSRRLKTAFYEECSPESIKGNILI